MTKWCSLLAEAFESTSLEEERSDQSESDFNFEELKQDYLDDDEESPPVDTKIASLFSSLKHLGLWKEKVAEMANINPMPKNCNLEIRHVNPDI